MRFVIIENGVVVNAAVADAPLAENWVESDTAAIGDLYADGAFRKPPAQPAPVPQEVGNSQAREAMIRSGISIAAVDSAIQAIADPIEKELAYTQWEYRTTIPRSASLVKSLGAGLGLTEEKIDDLFRLAATL